MLRNSGKLQLTMKANAFAYSHHPQKSITSLDNTGANRDRIFDRNQLTNKPLVSMEDTQDYP